MKTSVAARRRFPAIGKKTDWVFKHPLVGRGLDTSCDGVQVCIRCSQSSGHRVLPNAKYYIGTALEYYIGTALEVQHLPLGDNIFNDKYL